MATFPIPTLHSCVSVSDLYIPTIGLPILLHENYWTNRRIYSIRPADLWPSVPKLETGLLNAERVNWKSKVYSRVEQFTRPTECPTQPRRMINANRVYTFILQRNA
jgi:hypothetical protein